jgi:hypothetical protein
VEPYIRPTGLADMPPVILDIMGWDAGLWKRAAAPTYPCLVDESHVVAGLYDMVNVPTAVWIDEQGTIVRPPESAGSGDSFRAMNPATFEIPKDAAEAGKVRRKVYVEALRDWIAKGPKSVHALSPDEVRRRMRGGGGADAIAAANFRLGAWLHRSGHPDAARKYLDEAVRLRPESWCYRRQKIVLSDPALTGQFAATPEYWEAVQALGEGFYYEPIDMKGMPPPYQPGKPAK